MRPPPRLTSANSTPPTGERNAAATPAAVPATTMSDRSWSVHSLEAHFSR